VKRPDETSLKYLFLTFLKIGATSWGGFMALISVVQKQVVDKDKKIENETLLDGISLASVLPGPMAFNVVTYVGYKLKGFSGALVSMAAILLPSFVMMLVLSFLYSKYGNIPSFEHFFAGVLPAVAAIILSVAFAMAKKNISGAPQILIAVASALIIIFAKAYIATLIVMIISAFIGYLVYYKPSGISHTELGGGYVVIPAMQQVIVNSMGWLTNQEFTDAIAMGQITPGPIFISATFIGYKVAGFWGALNATIAIFLPPGLIMIVSTRFYDKIRNSAIISAAFKGLRPAIIGMIAAAAFTIVYSNELSLKTGLLLCLFLLLAIRYKADPVFLIPGAGLIGLLIF